MSTTPNADPTYPHGAAAEARIALLSSLMSALCLVMMAGAAAYVLLAGFLAWRIAEPDTGGLTPQAMLAIGVLWLASRAFLIWGLWHGARCFAGLARGRLFARRTIASLRNFALGLFLYKAMAPLMLLAAFVASLIQGFTLPQEMGMTNIGEGLFTLVSLGAIVVIAAVLARAAEIAEDHASIV